MVQFLLAGARTRSYFLFHVACAVLFLLTPVLASKTKEKPVEPTPPDMVLEGGRKLSYERSFSSQREVKPKRGFWNKVLDFVAGEPDFRSLVRPYSIVVDSRGRIIVSDPGAFGVHVFDFQQQKYKFLARLDKRKEPMLTPQCVAVDAQDNIYVTDSESGKVFVFNSDGKFQHTIGSLKGGEGFFKRPTGIAVDSATQRIYVTDTLRDKIFVMDMQGNVVQTIGSNGEGPGEFNFPTELRLDGQNLVIVDAMNFRVQVLDRSGQYQYAVGKLGDESGTMFRPKGIGFDSEGDLYVVDGLWGVVQAFNRQGELLYSFGERGTAPGEFQLPAGLFIDHNDRIYVVDSFNRRIQIFHFYAQGKPAKGGVQ